ncbi:hypothetical protein C8R47DRAFT_1176966 [Mycena vitilis]|nr:hypothetical protein C8R47DRAFT_1176966 [Mycena vitilis]
MKMALPKGVPTLRSFSTGNYTRVDNVFCSPSLLAAYITCDTAPELRPNKTDHMPVIQVLDLRVTALQHVPRPLFRKVIWSDFREDLLTRLEGMARPERYDNVDGLERAIRQLEEAVRATINATVKMSTPSPYMKRWFTATLRDMRTSWTKLERRAYAERFVPDHPVHGEARAAEAAYVKAVIEAKAAHWVEWLESITDLDVWDVHQLASAEPSDGVPAAGVGVETGLGRDHTARNRAYEAV